MSYHLRDISKAEYDCEVTKTLSLLDVPTKIKIKWTNMEEKKNRVYEFRYICFHLTVGIDQ
jgi:hypothetical protein